MTTIGRCATTATWPNHNNNLTTLGLKVKVELIQNVALLRTARILKKVRLDIVKKGKHYNNNNNKYK